MLKNISGFLVLLMVIGGFLSPVWAEEKETRLAPESQAAVENTVKLLSKIMEDAILKAAAKAVELLPDAKGKTNEELDRIMDQAVREITLEILKKEKFEDAVIETVSKCAEEAFKKGIEEAIKDEKAGEKKSDSDVKK